MLDFSFATSSEIVRELGRRLRAQRLASLMTQQELASRAGVALGSVKTLESTGRTTLETFVRVAQALSLVSELADILALKPQTSIAAMERAERATRQRAPRRLAKAR
ncbi:MAG TPA: transcriptional regulator [Ideonella sp.]|nr:transcriptional regulator [Ideonella sp.]